MKYTMAPGEHERRSERAKQQWAEGRVRPNKPIRERFMSYVQITESCWIWTGAHNGAGYGRFYANGHMVPAHRWLYEDMVGPIPEGLEIDHLCRNPPCVNPAHLEAVTHRENDIRGVSPLADNARKTHCVNGHPFDEENTFVMSRPGGKTSRGCRKCYREYRNGLMARKRQARVGNPHDAFNEIEETER